METRNPGVDELDQNEITDRLRHAEKKIKHQRSFLFVFFLIVLVMLSPFLFIFLLLGIAITGLPISISFADLTTLIHIFIIIFALFAFYTEFTLLMLVILTFTTYRRTKYTGFLIEALVESLFLIYSIFALSLVIFFDFNSLMLAMLNLCFMGSIFFLYRKIKKPLIWGSISYYWGLNSQRIDTKSSDIVMKQALYVRDFKNGFSSRPFFTSIRDIIPDSFNNKAISNELKRYANFLALNGDLIGFKEEGSYLRLFLRTSYIQKIEMFNVFVIFKKIFQMFRLKGLTCISIDIRSLEVNLKLNERDYNLLDDVTHHLLCQRLLAQFKISFSEFLQENYQESYFALNPKNLPPIRKTYFVNLKDQKFLGFLFIGYITGAVVYFLILAYFKLAGQFSLNWGIENTYTNPPIILLVIFWPYALWGYLQLMNNSYSGNLDLILANEFVNISLLVVSLVFIFIASIVIYFIVYRLKEPKIIREEETELKIP